MIRRRDGAAIRKQRSIAADSKRNALGSLSPQQVGGWRFTPEGAAVHVEERLAVIADVHLGYEWARGSGGDCIPAHSLAETLEKLSTLLARARIDRLVVAGDLVESPAPCARTAFDVRYLEHWLLERGVALVGLAGNHDAPGSLPERLEVAGWTIAHGHRALDAPRSISGHYHPVLRAGGHSIPCFLVGSTRIVLPAFSLNAAGGDVRARSIPKIWREQALRCVASASSEWFDFGPVAQLASVRQSGDGAPSSSRRRR